MAIFIDPPLWPAHGTMFSHLISDTSLDELHAFARAAGISERAFDGDHYDVPLHCYSELVKLGAQEVSSATLVRLLVASGQRIPATRRPSKVAKVLARRFDRLFPERSKEDKTPLLQDLLLRWAEPHRHYHDRSHLLAVLNAIDLLERSGESLGQFPRAVRMAAWFHDAVYRANASLLPGQEEEDSAVLAEEMLSDFGLPDLEIAETSRLIRLSAAHDPDSADEAGMVFSDADLEVLGRTGPDYQRYVAAVQQEFAHVPAAAFALGRVEVLRALLKLEPLYRTRTGRDRWEAQARRNLAAELHYREQED